MGDTRNGNQKENIEELIDYLISEHRDEFEIELSEKLRGFEAQLRGEFNRRLELIRKDLSFNPAQPQNARSPTFSIPSSITTLSIAVFFEKASGIIPTTLFPLIVEGM